MGVKSVYRELSWVLFLVWLASSHPGFEFSPSSAFALCLEQGVGAALPPMLHSRRPGLLLLGGAFPAWLSRLLGCHVTSAQVGLKLGECSLFGFFCVTMGAKFFPAFCILDGSRNLYFVFAKVADTFRSTNY